MFDRLALQKWATLALCLQVLTLLPVPRSISKANLNPTETRQDTPARSQDKTPWLADYNRASALIPSSLLPENQSTLFYTRAYR